MDTTQQPPQATIHPLLVGLNPEQTAVVLHDQGPLFVSAVAGSGKSRSLVHRLAYLTTVRGVTPNRIFCTTFSNKGAVVMNERLKALLPGVTTEVRTFHSFCRAVLADEFAGFGNWQLDGDSRGEQKKTTSYRTLVKMVVGHEGMNWARGDAEEILSFIGLAKAGGLRPSEGYGTDDAIVALAAKMCARPRSKCGDPVKMFEAFRRTEMARRDMRMMTFDDWLVDTRNSLRDNEDARARWAAKFDYIQVDEHQDTSVVQNDLVELLGRDHRNVMVVGDHAQSLYAFRGSRPELFTSFAETWQATSIAMCRNYRSGSAIIDAANVALGDMTQKSVPMICERGTQGEVRVVGSDTFDTEAASVASELNALHVDGVAWKDCAIIYRTNARSRAAEAALVEAKIPYRIVGAQFFYNRREVSDLLAYLRVVTKKCTMEHVERCLYAPKRFLGAKFVDRIRQAGYAEVKPPTFGAMVQQAIELSATVKKLGPSQHKAAVVWGALIDGLRLDYAAGNERSTPAALLTRIVKETDFNKWLQKDEGRESPENDRVANVAELIRAAQSHDTVIEFLQHVEAQKAVFAASKDDEKNPVDAVTLCTCHAAKGQEWPHVYLIACNDKILPHFFADDIEEERRIFYVAVTRARDSLRISYAESTFDGSGKAKPLEPSEFIPESNQPVYHNAVESEDEEVMQAEVDEEEDMLASQEETMGKVLPFSRST